MKISRQRKRAITLRKYFPVLILSVVSVGLGAMLIKHNDINLSTVGINQKNASALSDELNINKELIAIDEVSVNEQVQPVIAYKESSEIKDKVAIVNVSGEKNQVTIEAKQAKLSEVVQFIKSKFEVNVNDYTQTLDQLAAPETFILKGTLAEVLDSVMRRYGYENLVVNNETSTTPTTVYLLDAEISDAEIELLSNNEDVAVPETTVNRLLSKLTRSATSSTSGVVNKASSTSKAVNAKSSDANSQANTLSSPNINIENGEVPPELQAELAKSTQQAISDVQNLVQALRQNEAQMKANKFMNQQ